MRHCFYLLIPLLHSFLPIICEEVPHHADLFNSFDSDPSAVIEGCLNPIFGEYSIYENDLVVPGYEPLHFYRSYSSASQQGREAHWNILPHIYMYCTRPKHHKIEPLILTVSEPYGSSMSYKNLVANDGKDRFEFVPMLGKATKGLTNTSKSEISARSNIGLNRIFLDKSQDAYILTTANGTQRYYKKPSYIPFAYLEKEKQPNGNWIFYEYTAPYYTLKEIRSTNPQGNKTYAKVVFEHETSNPYNAKTFAAITQSGSLLHYFFHLDDVKNGKHNDHYFRLNCIHRPFLPKESLTYQEFPGHPPTFLVTRRSFNDTPYLAIDYYTPGINDVDGSSVKISRDHDPITHRVKSIKQPLGPNGALIQTHHFVYHLGKYARNNKNKVRDHLVNQLAFTHHFDAYQNKTEYAFNEYFVPLSISKFEKASHPHTEKILYQEHFGWCFSELINKLLYKYTQIDNTIPLAHLFEYDNIGNVTKKTILGNISGRNPASLNKPDILGNNILPSYEHYTIENTYTKSIPSLLQERRYPNGCKETYTYLPGTDLVTSCLIFDRQALKKRLFKFYNEDNVLIEEIVDNGMNQNPRDLTGVTFRKRLLIYPKKDHPALNFPEMIEELYWDKTSNAYLPLKKIKLHYSSTCNVLQEDIFDQNNTHIYSIHNTYDHRGYLTQTVDAIGRKSSFTYDDFGHIIQETSSTSPLTLSYQYDIVGRKLSQTALDRRGTSKTTSYVYDLNHRLIETKDPFNNITRSTYDTLDHEISTQSGSVLDANQNLHHPLSTKLCDIDGNPLIKIDPLGHKTKLSYNCFGKPTHILYPDGSQEFFYYDTNSRLEKHVSTTNITTLFCYDFLDRILLKKTYSPEETLLYQENFTYDSFHLLSHTDRYNTKTSYVYDAFGRKTEERKSKDDLFISHEKYTYDRLGRLSQTVICNSLHEPIQIHTKTFDPVNRLIEEKEETHSGTLLSKTSYLYDAYDNKIGIIHYPSTTVEQFTYDDHKRITSHKDLLGNTTHIRYIDRLYDHKTQTYEYKKITTDPKGNQIVEHYSSTEKLLSSTLIDPFGATQSTTYFYYDVCGNKTRQESKIFTDNAPAKLLITLWSYDAKSRVIEQIEDFTQPTQKHTYFSYTLGGQIEKVIQANGVSIIYSYDSLKRLTAIKPSDNSFHYVFIYNCNDQVIEEKDLITGAKTIRSYNLKGELITETLANGLTLHKTYDDLGRKESLTLPDRSSIRYTFDNFHLKQVSRYNARQDHLYSHEYLEYNLHHQPIRESSIFNLSDIVKDYDKTGKTHSIHAQYYSQEVLTSDTCGNILQLITTTPLATSKTSYSYDNLDHLIEESSSYNFNYSYDALHNRLSKNTSSYTINTLNELLGESGCTYSYNLCGDRILKTTAQQKLHYSYDAFHRLTSLKTDSIQILFTYDSWHRRLSKTIHALTGQGRWELFSHENYLYDDLIEIGMTDSHHNLHQLRVLGVGLGKDVGASVALELEGKVYLPCHDIFGNISALVDTMTLKTSALYTYTAFGEIVNDKPNLISPWRYQSKRVDDESRLIFFDRRYYDPKIGSWISPDPLAQSINLYQFLLGNPMLNMDIDGLAVEDRSSDDSLDTRPTPRTSRTFFSPDNLTPYDPLNPLATAPPGCMPSYVNSGFTRSNITPSLSPRISPTKASPAHPEYSFAFINGINTTWREAHKMGSSCANYLGHNVDLFYNQTQGLKKDLMLVRHHHKGLASDITQDFRKYLMLEVIRGKEVFVFAHSAGGGITYNVLKGLSRNFRTHIHVFTFGSAKYIPRDFAYGVVNFVSKTDLVSLQSNVWYARLNRRTFFAPLNIEPAPIQWLNPHGFDFLKEHSFMGATYQEALQRSCQELINY